MKDIHFSIGLMLSSFRKNSGLSIRNLSRGLCSSSVYCQIEHNEIVPNIRLMRLLFERLGRSFNKIEIIAGKNIYELEYKQLAILRFVTNGDFDNAKKMIEEIKKVKKHGDRVYDMYDLRNEAFLAYSQGNANLALEMMEKAVLKTVPLWKKVPVELLVLSTTELENIVICCFLRDIISNYAISGEDELLIAEITNYVNTHVMDEEERTVIISKLNYVKALRCINRKLYSESAELCDESLALLRKHELLYMVPELLNIITTYGKEANLREPFMNYVCYQNSINFVFELFPKYAEKYKYSIFLRSYKTLLHLDSEVARGIRKSKKLSQENFSENIYGNTESYSRMECGKVSMNSTSFALFSEKAALDKDKYDFVLSTLNIDAFGLVHESCLSAIKSEFEDADNLLTEIEDMVDADIKKNSETIMQIKNIVNILRLEDLKNIKQESIDFLQENYPITEMKMHRSPFYDEAHGISHLGICLYNEGKISEAKELFQNALSVFDESMIDRYFQNKTYGLLLNDYIFLSDDIHKEAEKMLEYELDVGGLSGIFYAMMAIGYSMRKNETGTGMGSQKYVEIAYWMARFIGRKQEVSETISFYESNYNKRIDGIMDDAEE